MELYTTEQLTERWEAHNEICNLVGRFSFYELLRDTETIKRRLWCEDAEGASLGLNDGYYIGIAEIRKYYDAVKASDLCKAAIAKDRHHDVFEGKAADDIIGVGSLMVLNLTTPVLEIAKDMKTAKGLWSFMGGSVEHHAPGGPSAVNRWGRIGIDFVKESTGWRIWHMIVAVDFEAPMGENWVMPNIFPEPLIPFTMQRKNHELYHERRVYTSFPEVPVAYGTFAETFSYGPEDN
ncbi:MAG: nuclear transport factor 2 family protein [Clostridiales Family XIII bacterium]|jgi:hypothetical protein|nr:nuclear transport factor 2 family protein [Clostridiales Family XIII bacterium]